MRAQPSVQRPSPARQKNPHPEVRFDALPGGRSGVAVQSLNPVPHKRRAPHGPATVAPKTLDNSEVRTPPGTCPIPERFSQRKGFLSHVLARRLRFSRGA